MTKRSRRGRFAAPQPKPERILGDGAKRAQAREAGAEAARVAAYERHGLRPVVTGVRQVGPGIVAVRDLVEIDQ